MAQPSLATSSRWLVVIGAGAWGLNHVRTAEEIGILGAVVDISADAREAARRLTSVPVLATLPSPLEPTGGIKITTKTTTTPPLLLTGAVIATPAPTHYAVAREALRAGLDVLVEKPMCSSVQDAQNLVVYARAQNRILMVGHLLLHALPHQRLIALVQARRIGQVTRVLARRFNFGKVRSQENVLHSFSPHDISILLAICCSPQKLSPACDHQSLRASNKTKTHAADTNDLTSHRMRVCCHGQSVIPENQGIHDHTTLLLEFDERVTARIEASWLHPVKERKLIVYGTEGCLILDEAGGTDNPAGHLQYFRWTVERQDDGRFEMLKIDLSHQIDDMLRSDMIVDSDTTFNEWHPDKSPLRRELEHFQSRCMDRRQDKIRANGNDGLFVTMVLSAATNSLQNDGTWQVIHLPVESACAKSLPEQQDTEYFVHSTACVDSGAKIGSGTKIWHFSHVMAGALVGRHCSFGQNTYIGGSAVIADGVRVQNNVSIYDGVELREDVFVGPSVVFTNVRTPRADFLRGKAGYGRTYVDRGATIGANATVICGVRIGARAMVGAGAVVTRDVSPHALVVGNPARRVGWVGLSGVPLVQSHNSAHDSVEDKREVDDIWICPESGETYRVVGDTLVKEDATVE